MNRTFLDKSLAGKPTPSTCPARIREAVIQVNSGTVNAQSYALLGKIRLFTFAY